MMITLLSGNIINCNSATFDYRNLLHSIKKLLEFIVRIKWEMIKNSIHVNEFALDHQLLTFKRFFLRFPNEIVLFG